jgi:hypothetical protein
MVKKAGRRQVTRVQGDDVAYSIFLSYSQNCELLDW